MVLRLNAEFFWRDQYKNEVDIIIKKGKKIIPIEVKSGNTFRVKALLVFMKKFGVDKGLVVTADDAITKEGIKAVPAYMLLKGTGKYI